VSESESIHVPSSTVRKIKPVLTWVWRGISAVSVAACGFGWVWLQTRASITDIGEAVEPALTASAAAQSTAHHSANVADAALRLAVETARMQAELWGQAVVERAYDRSPHRQEYIDRARAYYRNAFDDLRKSPQYASDPEGALERTRSMVWRPDRPD
jgi:hypothetical protein